MTDPRSVLEDFATAVVVILLIQALDALIAIDRARRRLKRRLGLHLCREPGCEREKVPGYGYCLDHGAGYR